MRDPARSKLFMGRLTTAKAARKTQEDIWTKLNNFYHLRNPQKSYNFVSFSRDYSNSIRARWVSGIFVGNNFHGLRGEHAQYDRAAEAMDRLLKYQYTKKMKLIPKLKRALRSVSYLGTKLLATYWNPATNSPGTKSMSLWDWWGEPYGPDEIKNMGYMITRAEPTLGHLKQMQAEGLVKDIDMVKESVVTRDGQGEDEKAGYEQTQIARGQTLEGAYNVSSDKDSQKVEIYEMWTKDGAVWMYDPKSEHFIEKDEVNPFKRYPFVIIRPSPEDGFIYGLSDAEPLLILQEELNENRFYRRKNMDIVQQGIWMAKRTNRVDWDRFRKKAFIFADQIGDDAIKRIQVENVLKYIDENERVLREYGDRNTNIFDPQRGGGEGQVTKTFRGLDLLVKEGNLIFAEEIANMQIEGFQELVYQYIQLNQQYHTGDTVVRLTNKDEDVRIDRASIQGQFEYVVTSSPGLGDKDAKKRETSDLQAKYNGDPDINQWKMKEKEFKAYDFEPDEVMYPEEESDIRTENAQLKQALAESEKAQAKGPTTTAGRTEPQEEMVV